MKKIFIALICVLNSSALWAGPFYFVPDGGILSAQQMLERGVKVTDAIRVSLNDDFKKKRFVYYKSCKSREGYIVSEENRFYIFRTVLSKNIEERIPKGAVLTVSEKKVFRWRCDPVLPYLWRSALVPGWGQLQKGHKSRAFAYLGGTLGAFLLFLDRRAAFTAADGNYQSQLPVGYAFYYYGLPRVLPREAGFIVPYVLFDSYAQNLNQERTQASTEMNVLMLVFLATYSFNLYDAVVGAPAENPVLKDEPGPKAMALGLFAGPRLYEKQNEKYMSVSLKFRF